MKRTLTFVCCLLAVGIILAESGKNEVKAPTVISRKG